MRDIGVTGVQTCALPISGDTVLMSRLLRELADAGTALAATSNTLPDALGEGRFAAEDFLREIQARSEERRVGQERRSRWAPHHQKNKACICVVYRIRVVL